MVYKSSKLELDLSELKNIYPAAVVKLDEDIAEMSLEWSDANYDKVEILKYILVFDFTPKDHEKKIKTILEFENKDELFKEMQSVMEVING
jgi:hypothetical protein